MIILYIQAHLREEAGINLGHRPRFRPSQVLAHVAVAWRRETYKSSAPREDARRSRTAGEVSSPSRARTSGRISEANDGDAFTSAAIASALINRNASVGGPHKKSRRLKGSCVPDLRQAPSPASLSRSSSCLRPA